MIRLWKQKHFIWNRILLRNTFGALGNNQVWCSDNWGQPYMHYLRLSYGSHLGAAEYYIKRAWFCIGLSWWNFRTGKIETERGRDKIKFAFQTAHEADVALLHATKNVIQFVWYGW